MNDLLDLTKSFVPLVLTVTGVALFLFIANRFLIARYQSAGSTSKIPRQIAMVGLFLLGMVITALALPVSESMQKQVIALIGIILSGALAFSSTTLIASLMAGLMLHMTKPFRTGDFVRVGDFFGRVSEQGLFDTEIQTEQRELVHLSNLFMIQNPVTVVRSSGTIVTASLSLGYDIHHARIHDLLIAAAEQTELDDAFVQIMELGNDSITYRVSGLLIEVKSLLTARSNLYRNILDALHGDGIEIVSPTFMNQRRLAEDARILPPTAEARRAAKAEQEDEAAPEEIIFDKAEQAERDENAKQKLRDAIETLEQQAAGTRGKEKARISQQIDQTREQLEALEHSPAPEAKPAPAPAIAQATEPPGTSA